MDQNAIFKAIEDRFREMDANVALNMAVLLIIVILIFLFFVLSRRGLHAISAREWRKEYSRLIRKFDLTINELDLLNRMAAYLDDPSRKDLLLTNRNTYHHILLLLEKKEGGISRFAESLTHKLYEEGARELPEGFETLFGLGRPARYISPEGDVFGGQIILRESGKIILGNVHPLKKKRGNLDIRGGGRIFIQDYRGLISHGVTEKIVLSETSLQLNLDHGARSPKNGFSLPDIYIFLPGRKTPLESQFYSVSEGMGLVKNPGGQLKMDQTVKVALQKDTSHHYHVNAIVRGVSLNKRYARLKFGYLNEKFYT